MGFPHSIYKGGGGFVRSTRELASIHGTVLTDVNRPTAIQMPSLNQIKGGESLFTDLPTIPSLKLTSPRSEGEFHFWERFSFREILVGGFKYFLCSPLFGEMIQFD